MPKQEEDLIDFLLVYNLLTDFILMKVGFGGNLQMRMYWGFKRGLGKTTSVVNEAIQFMIASYRDIIYSYDKVDYYNSLGFNFSKNYKHLCFANFDINTEGSEVPFLKSYKANPYKFGLHSKKYKTDVYPFGTVFFITEFQRYVDSDMYKNLRPEVKAFYQTSRHSGYDFVVDCQRPHDIAAKIRDLFDEFYECLGIEHLYKNGVCYAHKINYRIIRNSRILEQYLKTNDKSLCEEKTEIIPCRFDNFDSFFCELINLKGRETQDYSIKYFGEEDDSDIYKEPEDYYIKSSDRVKSSEGEEELL